MDWYSYWPPFADPSWPNPDEGMPAYQTVLVTCRVGDEVKTIERQVPMYYL